MGIPQMFETLGADIKFAARSLRKNPGFLTVVVLSLALGIAANSTIFSVMDALLYRPLPYPQPENLVVIWQVDQAHPDSLNAPPIAENVDWNKQNHVFDDISLSSFTDRAIVSGVGEPRPLHTQYVTPNFFDMLGAKPVLGRIFASDEQQDLSQTVVISTPFWKNEYHSDPHVLGKTMNIEGVVSTIVGVMPQGFAPFYGYPIDVWQPINPANPRYNARFDHWLMPVGRLKPGVTLAQAQADMEVVAQRLAQDYPSTNKGLGDKVIPLQRDLYRGAGSALYPLLGAVAFVLLIACVNVANLMQFRTETRRKEYALRMSLGAERRRLVQQLLTESALLALAGGVLGTILTFVGIKVFLALADDFPNADSITVDGRVLLFALGISLLTAILFGLAPALRASNPDLNAVMRESERKTTSAASRLARHALVISEVALAMVLLVGAGLMINTILHLKRVNPGFDYIRLLAVDFQLPEGGKYLQRVPGGDMERTLPTATNFYTRLLENARGLPGVESAALIGAMPTRCCAERYTFSILGHAVPSEDNRPTAGYSEISAGIFNTMKVPLIKGRYVDEHDTASAPWVIDVNQAFARKYFPNEDPIGQQILLRYDPYPVEQPRPRQIVGVVGDMKHFGLGEETPPFVYASYLQQPDVFPGGATRAHLHENLVLRTAHGREAGLAVGVKDMIANIDPDQPVGLIRPMDQVLNESLGDWRFYMQLLGIFATVAVLLAAVGIYGVMSYSVNERTHEIGIRMALGAQPSDVLRLVTKMGLKLTCIGVVVGAALALGLARLITTFLYGVKPSDPITYVLVALALAAVALLACYIPARRATKVDPMIALRYE
ncbi:MAG: ABC transporter permease [Candidatus Acidiferrales bacterium]